MEVTSNEMWISLSEIPEEMGDTISERVKKFVDCLNQGIMLIKTC